MARLRSASSTQQSSPPIKQTRQALKEKTNTARTKAPVYEDDGSTEGLVKDARPGRARRKKLAQDSDELVMAGGLGQAGSDEQTVPHSGPPMTTDELAKSDAPVPPNAKASRRPPRTTRKAVQSQAQSGIMEDMKKRMQATARKEAATKRSNSLESIESTAPSSDALPTKASAARSSTNTAAERSEFLISPSPPPQGKLSSVRKQRSSFAQPGSAMRPQGIPAVDTSMLALKNFKRRPRQPSMLQMVQQRTTSARPSAVNAQTIEDPRVFDVQGDEDEAEDEEEFVPEAEGTPQHSIKANQRPPAGSKKPLLLKQKSLEAQSAAAASRKRKSDETEHSSSALSVLKAKRQKSTLPGHRDEPLAAFQESKSVRGPSSDRQSTPPPRSTPNVEVINSPPSSTPPSEPPSADKRTSVNSDVIPSTEQEKGDAQYVPLEDIEDDREQDFPNGTMAEPASSSPSVSEPLATQRTDIMADPLTQVSPPRPQRGKPKKKAKPMTTATLQSLLPKRRQPQKPRHRKSEYDIDSDSDGDSPLDASHLDPNEDEISGKRRRQTKTPAAKGKKTPAPKSKARQSKAAPTSRKSSAPLARKSSAPLVRKKANKVYGRATTSDKENEDDNYESLDENDESALPDTSISMHEAARSKELEEAKQKFADLDEWEMEFESMSVEEGRSSSQQWR